MDKMQLANKVYATLCSALDARNWRYKKNDEELSVSFGVKGDDLPMDLVIRIDGERQLIHAYSPLPFKFSENKRLEGAVAACVASYGMTDGSFDYNIATGTIVFRVTTAFHESVIGEGLFEYLIDFICAVVDVYNDKFFALDKGMMSIDDFIAAE